MQLKVTPSKRNTVHQCKKAVCVWEIKKNNKKKPVHNLNQLEKWRP